MWRGVAVGFRMTPPPAVADCGGEPARGWRRQSCMRKRLVVTGALLAVIALSFSGCGRPSTPLAGVTDPAATPNGNCTRGDAATVISLSEADRDAHVCIAVGQKLRVILKSEPENLWQPI